MRLNLTLMFLRNSVLALLLAIAALLHLPAGALENGERVQWPDFTLLDGRPVNGAHLQDRFVFLQVWASWCPYCKLQNASLPAFQKRWEARGGMMLTLATDKSAEALRSYVDEKNYRFPVAHATSEQRKWLGKIKSVPTVYIIGPDGSVLKKIEGQMLEEDLFELVDLLPPQTPSGGRR